MTNGSSDSPAGSLDTVPESDHGQASGVSATAEQFGGAVGIAGLYLIFHASYLNRLNSDIARSALPQMTRSRDWRRSAA
jgi:hypothetical protein